MQSLIKLILLFLVILQISECQYISRGTNYFHNPYKSGMRYVPSSFKINQNNDEYNTYRNFNNDYKNNVNNNNNNNENPNPVTVHYYYKHKPLEKRLNEVRPVQKPEAFVEDYTEDEYAESLPDDKIPGLDSFHSGVNYEKKDEDHHEKDYKEEADKKFAAIDKHLDSGHKKAELVKVGGFHDKHVDGKHEAEHKNYKKDGEYSHDRGHGFIKAWSWDRKNIKGNVEGQKTKELTEISTGDKGAFGAIKAKGSEAHDKKGLSAIGGQAGYGKAGHEESSHKCTKCKKYTSAVEKSDYDKEFPIFG